VLRTYPEIRPHHLQVKVFRQERYWDAFPVDAPGFMSGDSLPELLADVEFSKYFCLWVPNVVPISVEYIPGQPWIAEELEAYHEAFMSIPEDLRPRPVAWDHDNDRPMNPAHTGPFLNMDTYDWASLATRFSRSSQNGHNGVGADIRIESA
jgi:hypothetical protein